MKSQHKRVALAKALSLGMADESLKQGGLKRDIVRGDGKCQVAVVARDQEPRNQGVVHCCKPLSFIVSCSSPTIV